MGLDKTIIEFQNKIIYILEFHWRKDKIKLSLILCCLDFQHIMFPTIISDCRGRKGGELPFTLVEDFNWKFISKSTTTGKLVLNNYSSCLIALVTSTFFEALKFSTKSFVMDVLVGVNLY